jgi:hypothetical protein
MGFFAHLQFVGQRSCGARTTPLLHGEWSSVAQSGMDPERRGAVGSASKRA